jgi:uncharacterized protein YxjI
MNISQNKLMIKQKVEALEIFTDFETANRYEILDESGNQILFYAYEESNFFLNQILGTRRPTKIIIIDKDKKPQFILERPFYFLKADCTIKSPGGEVIGYIKQKKWFMHHISFDIYDKNNQLLFTCSAKMPHFWTFNIFMNQNKVAQILKKWSGIGREAFTDSDTFLVDFGSVTDQNLKQILLAAAFVIDLRVFERKK